MSQSANPFRYFHSSPEIIRLAVLLYVRFPHSAIGNIPPIMLANPTGATSPPDPGRFSRVESKKAPPKRSNTQAR